MTEDTPKTKRQIESELAALRETQKNAEGNLAKLPPELAETLAVIPELSDTESENPQIETGIEEPETPEPAKEKSLPETPTETVKTTREEVQNFLNEEIAEYKRQLKEQNEEKEPSQEMINYLNGEIEKIENDPLKYLYEKRDRAQETLDYVIEEHNREDRALVLEINTENLQDWQRKIDAFGGEPANPDSGSAENQEIIEALSKKLVNAVNAEWAKPLVQKRDFDDNTYMSSDIDREKLPESCGGKWYSLKDLENVGQSISWNGPYNFQESERDSGYVVVKIPNSTDILAIPADPGFFVTEGARKPLQRTVTGLLDMNSKEEIGYGNSVVKPIRLRLVTQEEIEEEKRQTGRDITGQYKAVEKGEVVHTTVTEEVSSETANWIMPKEMEEILRGDETIENADYILQGTSADDTYDRLRGSIKKETVDKIRKLLYPGQDNDPINLDLKAEAEVAHIRTIMPNIVPPTTKKGWKTPELVKKQGVFSKEVLDESNKRLAIADLRKAIENAQKIIAENKKTEARILARLAEIRKARTETNIESKETGEVKIYPTEFVKDAISNILKKFSTVFIVESLVVDGNGEVMKIELELRSSLSSGLIDASLEVVNSYPVITSSILIHNKEVKGSSALKRNFNQNILPELDGLTDELTEMIMETKKNKKGVKTLEIVNGNLKVTFK